VSVAVRLSRFGLLLKVPRPLSAMAATGIIKTIRATTGEGEEFDLAGSMNEAQARELIRSAFTEPLTCKPCKLTFIVGGGKAVRSRYDEALPKWLSSELRALKYEEDKSAALGDQGSFKHQHDTGANLIYLHVYPIVVVSEAGAAGAGAGSGGEGRAGAGGSGSAAGVGPAGLALESPEYTLLTCPLDQFQKAVAAKVVSYAQKKRLAALLGDYEKRLETHEAKMIATAAPLSATEQAEYDLSTREALAEKSAWLQKEMKDQVAAGRLTAPEREKVAAAMSEKATSLKAELAAAKEAGAAKKVTALEAAVAQLEERRAAVAAAPAINHPVRADGEMRKALSGIEAADRLKATISRAGRLASLAESHELAKRSDHEERLAALRAEARGWFEADDEFDARCAAAMKALAGAGGRRR